MRIHPILTFALLAAPIYGQTAISLKGSTTTATSRGSIGTNTGEILTGFHRSHWRGIGDNAGSCQIQGFRATVQDQDSSTKESYHWVIRKGSDAAGPAVGSAGLLHSFGSFDMPKVKTGGPHAWSITVTLATPATIPCLSHVSVGIRLKAAAQWPNDGMSCHMSPGTSADQHGNAHDMSWQIEDGWVDHPSGNRAWAQSVLVNTPTLQMSINGKKSIGGMFPKSGHLVYAANVSGAEANANSLLFLGVDTLPFGFPLVPGTARMYLGFTKIKLLTATTADGNGDAYHSLGFVPSRSPIDTLYLQVAIFGATRHYLTNLHATTFDQ